MKLVDALVETLRDWQIGYVFGVSGANIEHVHDAIHRLKDDRLISIMSKCEDGAAFMADGRARVHRTLGVCCSTSGGGMVNLLAGIAEAYAESVPVLALVGQPPTNLEGKGAFQDSSGLGRSVDGLKLWGAVSKYTAKITSPDQFWPCLKTAVVTALNDRPGPAVLLFPRDLYDQEVPSRPNDWPLSLAAMIHHTKVAREHARPIFDALRQAKNPMMLIGHGVRRSSNAAAVVKLAQTANIPVATTMSGRSEFPNYDPLYLGMIGVAGHPSAHNYLKETADLILVVGAGLNIMTRGAIASFIGEKRIAAINIDPGEISRALSPALVLAADAGQACQTLLELWEDEPFTAAFSEDYQLQQFAPTLAPPIPADDRPIQADEPLLQSQAIELLSEILPTNGHIVFDAGNCAAAALHMTRVPEGVSSTIALGMGGMGYAFAAAVGIQLGSPTGTRTIAFCGDGALLMVGFEIHTAVDLRLPILFVVFNNNMHGMCVTRQQLFFDSRLECVRYSMLDVATIARGMGTTERLWVGSAGTLTELRQCIADYQQHTEIPGVLELRLLREEVPPFTPFLPTNAKTAISGVKTDAPG